MLPQEFLRVCRLLLEEFLRGSTNTMFSALIAVNNVRCIRTSSVVDRKYMQTQEQKRLLTRLSFSF